MPPPTLFCLSLARLAGLVERLGPAWDRLGPGYKGPLDDLAGPVVEQLLLQLVQREPGGLGGPAGRWRDWWRVCLTPRLQSSPAVWDAGLLRSMAARCRSLRRLWVLGCDLFRPDVLASLPAWVLTVDFDGQLYFRGRQAPVLSALLTAAPTTASADVKPWLIQAEILFRALSSEQQRVPEVKLQPRSSQLQLVELHLGEAHASAEDIKEALRQLPQLRLLRHYQLVTALYQLHAAEWRDGGQLRTYKLRNLDADFSHVVRCRMSPEPVLAADALQLAVQLCPSASQVRVRFDPQTPHDVLGPVAALAKLQLLSAVCVSSGQRAHLDFSDVAGVLEAHGDHLRTLELKVLEEVDVHLIVALCPRLEELVLSGCGNVVPPACASWGCESTTSAVGKLAPLRRLRLLFFADGDDFSWDHDVPQCFWRWTLMPAVGRNSHLEGIFLESPRFAAETIKMITHFAGSQKSAVYPDLEVLSVCRAPEFTLDLVASLCGFVADPGRRQLPGRLPGCARPLRLVHLNQCDRVAGNAAVRLREALGSADPHQRPTKVVID